MAIRTLLSASKLEGFYDLKTQELKLVAEINIDAITWGIEFNRVPWLGAFKFDLTGWTDAPIPPEKKLFEQIFPIPSLLPVLVVDLENPNGVVLDIHVVGGLNNPDDATKTPATPSNLTNLNEVYPQTPIKITTLYKGTFEISLPSSLPKFGEILPQFDEAFLRLDNARIIDGNIVWTFRSLSLGSTQILINILGGVALYHKTITYDILSLPPLEPGPVIPPKATDPDSEILSFLGRVNIARTIVEAQYKDVNLMTATGKTNLPDGVDSVALLLNLTIIFRVDGGYVTIESTGYSEFGTPIFVDHPILGLANVPWPVEFTAEEAQKLLRAEGHKGNFTNVQLKKLLYPDTQDFYVFDMVEGEPVWVGLLQKDVVVGGPK